MTDVDQLFDQSSGAKHPDHVDIDGIFNTHTHPRNPDEDGDGRAEMHIPLLADAYEDAMGMGNTKVALTTADLARRMGARWRSLIPRDKKLRLHVAGLMIESTDPEDVIRGYDTVPGSEAWIAMKMFMRSVSNAGGADVDDLPKVVPVIRAMAETRFVNKRAPMPLAVHAERKYGVDGKRIFFLKRDAESMDRDIRQIFDKVPGARVVICHVKSAYAIRTIRELRAEGCDIRGEISPHYGMYSCDDLFEGPNGSTMLNIHRFCLPIFGTEEDREANDDAMLSGEEFWFFGDDEACHWVSQDTGDPEAAIVAKKINDEGFVVGGQTQLPLAVVSYVIERFAETGKLHLLNAFLSGNGRRAYNLPESKTVTRFKRRPWTVPSTVGRDSEKLGILTARVAMGGQRRLYLPEGMDAPVNF